VLSDKARACLLYGALTLVLAYPLSIHPATTLLPGDPDSDLFMWTLAWDTHALVTRPLSIFDANIFYPYDDTLAYSENLIGSAPFAAPVLWLVGNPILALNIVALLSVVLCGLGAYVLGRRLGMNVTAALICGLVFAFAPTRFFRIGQLHLTTVQWVPFGLAALHGYLDTGRARQLKLAAFLFTLQAFTSGHGAVFLTLAMGGLLAYRFVLGDPVAPVRRLRDLGLTGALLLAPTAFLFLPYSRVQVEMGLRRSLVDWAPSLESFLASPAAMHTWLVSLWPEAAIMDRATSLLFPGVLPIALAAVALVWGRVGGDAARDAPADGSRWARWAAAHRRDPVLFYGLLTGVTILLSIGPPLGVWPLVYWLPGLNFIRVPSRFTILATLSLAVLAGIGASKLVERAAPGRRRLWAIGLGILMLAESASVPLPTRAYAVNIPEVDRWLDTRPKPFAVAELPVDGSDRIQSVYMLHSMAHWQRTVHGHSGIRPPLHDELYRELRTFPDARSLDSLTRLGVDYVVVHPHFYRPGQWEPVDAELARLGDRLELVFEADGSRVYVLKPGAAPRSP